MKADCLIPVFGPGRFSVVAIGSSTGGPMLVEKIITGLPADMSVPIFIAQHLPPSFTESLAVRLDHGGALTTVHAEDGMPVFPGTVYLGRGRQHIRVKSNALRKQFVEISSDPEALLFKPSVDELFTSCAKVYGSKTLAVVLTGIGQDGTRGAKAIHDAGGMVLTQESTSCSVYGMPRSCVEAGLSDAQLTPEQIRLAILQLSPSFEQNRKSPANLSAWNQTG